MKARILLCGMSVLLTVPLGVRTSDRLTMRVSPNAALVNVKLLRNSSVCGAIQQQLFVNGGAVGVLTTRTGATGHVAPPFAAYRRFWATHTRQHAGG
jgi:hypothetical protein